MRRLLLLIPLLGITACQRYEGPMEVYRKNRSGDVADRPGYTIAEQKVRGRERLTLIEDDPRLYPKGYVDGPGGVGR
jgi:hypothetical protein